MILLIVLVGLLLNLFIIQVEKLCHRFHATTTERQWRDIGFCLGIFNYNDKAAKKLIDNFNCYSDKLHEDSLYEAILAILTQVCKVKKLGFDLITF